MTLAQLQKALRDKQASLQALLAKGEGLSADELTQAETLTAECEALQQQITEAQSTSARLAQVQSRAGAVADWSTQLQPAPGMPGGGDLDPSRAALAPKQPGGNQFAIPATVRRGRVKNFKDRDGIRGEERAYGFGMWLLASRGSQRAQGWCRERGIGLHSVDGQGNVHAGLHQFAQSENVNTAGGVLVPTIWDNDLIDLREQYGLVRQLFRNRTMISDSTIIPRRTGGLTAYFATDNQAATESTKNWDNALLNAKKLIVLAKASSELIEDAIIDVADDLAYEIAYALAEKEDRCGLVGDATSTYGGIVGVCNALLNLSTTRANIAGLHVGTGNLWSELILTDFNNTKAKLPAYAAQDPETCWVVSQPFWSAVMEKLMLAAGGITDAMIAAGVQPRMLGYPVKISQAMPLVEANDQVCALLGSFRKSASFGDRRQTTIMMSEHSSFGTDSLDIRGTERFDINVHDIGNASATAADRVAGPVVGLLTAAA